MCHLVMLLFFVPCIRTMTFPPLQWIRPRRIPNIASSWHWIFLLFYSIAWALEIVGVLKALDNAFIVVVFFCFFFGWGGGGGGEMSRKFSGKHPLVLFVKSCHRITESCSTFTKKYVIQLGKITLHVL